MNNLLKQRVNDLLFKHKLFDNINKRLSKSIIHAQKLSDATKYGKSYSIMYCGLDTLNYKIKTTILWSQVTCKNCLACRDKH